MLLSLNYHCRLQKQTSSIFFSPTSNQRPAVRNSLGSVRRLIPCSCARQALCWFGCPRNPYHDQGRGGKWMLGPGAAVETWWDEQRKWRLKENWFWSQKKIFFVQQNVQSSPLAAAATFWESKCAQSDVTELGKIWKGKILIKNLTFGKPILSMKRDQQTNSAANRIN